MCNTASTPVYEWRATVAMTLRNIRIDEELWAATMEKAALEGRTASEVVREFLTQWVTKPPRPVEKPKLRTWKD